MTDDAMLRWVLEGGYTTESAARAVQEAPEGQLWDRDLLKRASAPVRPASAPTPEN